ncbi:hypothetical protein AVEN_273840-1 [Araneus ventricosus]|uniref:DDE-1 domain-containing protein n=1 Tax=Araneus ventricosus TaxID=182803 RepID=A0A4Y2L2Q0_ARAVE|nr:hypothetical protein AVEN_273840-1 [Araneus ventricosus]
MKSKEFIRSKTQIQGVSIVLENENRFQGANEPCVRRTMRKGNWFDESKLSIPEFLILTYLWVKKRLNDWIVDKTNVAKPTVVNWKSFCQEVCVDMLVNESEEMLDGIRVVVEIDESKLVKGSIKKEEWMASGGIERGSKEFFGVVEDRTADVDRSHQKIR